MVGQNHHMLSNDEFFELIGIPELTDPKAASQGTARTADREADGCHIWEPENFPPPTPATAGPGTIAGMTPWPCWGAERRWRATLLRTKTRRRILESMIRIDEKASEEDRSARRPSSTRNCPRVWTPSRGIACKRVNGGLPTVPLVVCLDLTTPRS